MQNDPVNYNDPSGLMLWWVGSGLCTVGSGEKRDIVSCDFYTNVALQLGATPQNIAYVVAAKLAKLVDKGHWTDCEALAEFADEMAGMTSSKDAFVEAFGVLVPKQLATQVGRVPWNSRPVYLNTGQPSGYAPEYQNTTPDGRTGDPSWNGDQGHHFAAFFEYGYQNPGSGSSTAYWFEVLEGFRGTFNQNDVNLGVVAAQMGAALKAGIRSASEIAGLIRDLVCAK